MTLDPCRVDSHSPAPEKPRRGKFLNSSERSIFGLGLALSFLGLAALVVSWLRAPETTKLVLAMTATHILSGRAIAMSFGYVVGFGHAVVVPVNMLIETIMVLLFYPLFVSGCRSLVVFRPLQRIIDRTHRTAQAHRETISRYGVLGLFAFVCIPFWMTGPVVGCAIGYLLGLRPWFNLAIVLTGTYLATFGWAVVLIWFRDVVTEYSPIAPLNLIMIAVLVVAVALILRGLHTEEDSRKK